MARPTGQAEKAAEIGVRAGKIINHYKMAKHFTLTIRDGYLGWARKQDAIRNEELLDGIYVIRTSEPAERLTAADGVRSYKRLALVEQCVPVFQGDRSLGTADSPPHRPSGCGRTSCCACWPSTWSGTCGRRGKPLLFEDEELDRGPQRRDPVAPAQASKSCASEEEDAPDARRICRSRVFEPCWLIWEHAVGTRAW